MYAKSNFPPPLFAATNIGMMVLPFPDQYWFVKFEQLEQRGAHNAAVNMFIG